MLDTERPISIPDDDLLNRAPLAKTIARGILAYQKPENLTLAIDGEWGSGKTSLIRLILGYLNDLSEPTQRPIIVNFDAWGFVDRQNLIGRLSDAAASAYQKSSGQPYNVSTRAWSALKSRFKLMASESDDFTTTAGLFTDIGVCVTTIGAPQFLPIAAGASLTARLAGVGAKHLKAVLERLDRDRTRLNDLLSKQRRKLVLVVDNLDRLNANEVMELFQFIKSVIDLPNTVILLAFDYTTVSKFLDPYFQDQGRLFIQKIVNAPFRLPAISTDLLDQYILKKLKSVSELLESADKEKNHWSAVYLSSRSCFTTLRDVNQFVNMYSSTIDLIGRDTNPIDLFGMTVIQAFDVELYNTIRMNRSLFIGASDPLAELLNDADARNRLRERITKIMDARRGSLSDLLEELFPTIDYARSAKTVSASDRASWRRSRRVCSDETFDTYFSLGIPQSDLSEEEFLSIVAQASDAALLAAAIGRIVYSERVRSLLSLLELRYRELDVNLLQNFIAALVQHSELFGNEYVRGLPISNDDRAAWVICKMLSRMSTAVDRFNALKYAFDFAKVSLFLPAVLIYRLEQVAQGPGGAGPLDEEGKLRLAEAHLTALKTMYVTHAWDRYNDSDLLTNKSLWDSHRMIAVLRSWVDWGQSDDVRGAIENALRSDKETRFRMLSALVSRIGPLEASFDSKMAQELMSRKFLEQMVSEPRDALSSSEAEVIGLVEKALGTKRV